VSTEEALYGRPCAETLRAWEEPARQAVRALAGTPAYERSRRARYQVEALFAELKQRLRVERVRLRRLWNVAEQFHLAATAQNLKRLVQFLARGQPGPALRTAEEPRRTEPDRMGSTASDEPTQKQLTAPEALRIASFFNSLKWFVNAQISPRHLSSFRGFLFIRQPRISERLRV